MSAFKIYIYPNSTGMASHKKISRYFIECFAFHLDILMLLHLILWKYHKNSTFSIPHTVCALTGSRWDSNSKKNVPLYF